MVDCQVEPSSKYTLLNGLVRVPDRRTQWRAAAGIGLWLGAPLLAMRLLGRAGRRRELHRVARWWARGVARHLAIRPNLSGLDLIDPSEAYVVTPLHEGFADALALLQLPLDLRFAARDELFGWRLFGGLLRDTEQLLLCPELGMLSYLQLRRQAPAVFEGGESLVVFPQGSILGIEIDFKAGPFALAEALGRPLLPVALTGSHRVWEHPFSPRLRYGQRLSLAVLPPIMPDELRALGVEGARVEVQRRLKARALDGRMAPPRRFVPARDGYWDGYAYEIDPAFPSLQAEISRHRAQNAPIPDRCAARTIMPTTAPLRGANIGCADVLPRAQGRGVQERVSPSPTSGGGGQGVGALTEGQANGFQPARTPA